MSLKRLFAALLLTSIGPVFAAESLSDANACLSIGETAPNQHGERFHRIGNACSHEVVIFYCRVIELPHDAELAVGTCQKGKAAQLAAFPTAARELGVVNQAAPGSSKVAVLTSANGLDMHLAFDNPYRESKKSSAALVAEIGRAPASMFIIKSGAEFISATTSSHSGANRAALVPSACAVEMYLNGKCQPDAFAVWRRLGAPTSPADAIVAVSRLERP